MKIRPIVNLYVGGLFVLMTGRAVWTASTFDRVLSEYDQHIARDKEIDDHIDRVEELVINLETGVRGWQITGSAVFREPYDQGEQARDADTEGLIAVSRADLVEMQIAEQVRDRLVAWDSDIAQPLLAQPGGGSTSPEHLALTLEGKRRIDAIRMNFVTLRAGTEKRREIAAATLGAYRRDIWTHALMAFGLALVLLVAVWLSAAAAIERALRQLVEHAHRMLRGELAPIQVRSVGEIEDLAGLLSRMATQLAAERERERRFAHLGEALAKGGDLRGIADTALQALIADNAATGGVLWIARDGEVEAVAATAVEPSELAGEGARRALDVARSGRIRRVVLDEERAQDSRPARSSLMIPIAAGTTVIGVIELLGAPTSAAGLEQSLLAVLTRIGLGLALQRVLDAVKTDGLIVALAEQRQRLETIFEALGDAVLFLDAAGQIQVANPAARRFFGRLVTDQNISQLDELAQKQLVDGSTLRPEQTIRGVCLVRGQPLLDVVRRMVSADGTVRIVVVNGVPILHSERSIGAVVVFHDITEEHSLRDDLARVNERLRKQNQELASQQEELQAQAEKLVTGQAELAIRNELLARSSRLKSDFLASVSHELRTPLNAVIGFSELLLVGSYGPVVADQERVLRDVLSAASQLLTLINDVLDLSKIEAGRIETHSVRVDIGEAMTQACHLVAGAARARSVTLASSVQEGALFVIADPDRLRQVLLNLVANAVKFTPPQGSVTLDASIQGEKLRVGVSDTGIGIAPADAEKLFVPFSQIDSGYTRHFQGTGLGLSISKQLVELMGGEIGFTSELGKGSVFFFTLPLASDRPLLHSSRPAPRASDSAPVASPQGSRPMVLVVENKEPDGRFIEMVIERGGFNVTRAHDAKAALEMIDAARPALMVVDLGLPGLSGEELIEQVRARGELPRLPIAVFSGRDLSRDERARLSPLVETILQKGTLSHAELFQRFAALCSLPEPTSPVRVLVIDDTALNRKLLRAMLQGPECEVLEAENGPNGIEAARTLAPAVILMDMHMPGMDGLTATAALKADARTSGIPVIAVTAHAMTGDAERMLAAGCVGYVSKPVSRTKLDEALDLALGSAAWRGSAGRSSMMN
jgi:PAS domain S-box-containing protein